MNNNGKILTIDIGNTNIKAVIFNKNIVNLKNELPEEVFVIKSDIFKGSLLFNKIFNNFNKILYKKQSRNFNYFRDFIRFLKNTKDKYFINSVYCVSVNNKVDKNIIKILYKIFKSVKILPDALEIIDKLPFRFKYKNPATYGKDRLSFLLYGFYKYGPPLIAIDAGTAITFDVINFQNKYAGGFIIPSMDTQLKSLHLSTAALPELDSKFLSENYNDCFSPGYSTAECIVNGIEFEISSFITSAIVRFIEKICFFDNTQYKNNLFDVKNNCKDEEDRLLLRNKIKSSKSNTWKDINVILTGSYFNTYRIDRIKNRVKVMLESKNFYKFVKNKYFKINFYYDKWVVNKGIIIFYNNLKSL